ncbi:hypothetical protein OSB04_001881 [Centaurea solstitialis]|uniref:Uncharacterized protein n=1 Tax=Centaurea solstitialis TaxID=347529 RepID=A0AA38U3J2_9ASTR|nr:hypothetical protein OSB04_001881 [Centaurea solstitialis]
MEGRRNWMEMPDEIMGGMILGRLDAVEILTKTQKVCMNWRRICKKDPEMWKMIRFDYSENDFEKFCEEAVNCSSGELIRRICKDPHVFYTRKDFEKLCKQAVYRSSGGLIDISLKGFGTDHLLDFISRSSSKLNRLCLTNCHKITGCGLNNALERLPHLETLELSYIYVYAKDIEAIGRNCPHLKSFKIRINFLSCNTIACAIANSMPALRHLELIATRGDNDVLHYLELIGTWVGNDGVRAILNGCPHLESLHILNCFHTLLDSDLEKLCRERITDFQFS